MADESVAERLRKLVDIAEVDPSWVGRSVTALADLLIEAAGEIEWLRDQLDRLTGQSDLDFARAVAHVIRNTDDMWREFPHNIDVGPAASAILAMQEMRAIASVLHRIGVRGAAGVDARWQMLWNDLPDNVKQWAQVAQ